MCTGSRKCPRRQGQVSEHVNEHATWFQISERRHQNVPRCSWESGERGQENPSQVSGSEVLQSEPIEFAIDTKVDRKAIWSSYQSKSSWNSIKPGKICSKAIVEVSEIKDVAEQIPVQQPRPESKEQPSNPSNISRLPTIIWPLQRLIQCPGPAARRFSPRVHGQAFPKQIPEQHSRISRDAATFSESESEEVGRTRAKWGESFNEWLWNFWSVQRLIGHWRRGRLGGVQVGCGGWPPCSPVESNGLTGFVRDWKSAGGHHQAGCQRGYASAEELLDGAIQYQRYEIVELLWAWITWTPNRMLKAEEVLQVLQPPVQEQKPVRDNAWDRDEELERCKWR